MGTRQVVCYLCFHECTCEAKSHGKLAKENLAVQTSSAVSLLSVFQRICCIENTLYRIIGFVQDTEILSVGSMDKALQNSSACLPWIGVTNPGILSYGWLRFNSHGIAVLHEAEVIRCQWSNSWILEESNQQSGSSYSPSYSPCISGEGNSEFSSHLGRSQYLCTFPFPQYSPTWQLWCASCQVGKVSLS